METRTATCHCGQLSLTVRGTPALVSACNCTLCQKRTGSVFSWSARWPRAQAEPLAGESRRYERTGASGGRATLHFCPQCGSTVMTELEVAPDLIGVPAGCFADATFPAPQVAFWCESQVEWTSFPAGALRVERQDMGRR